MHAELLLPQYNRAHFGPENLIQHIRQTRLILRAFMTLLIEFQLIQNDTKERELLKCVVAAMYSWQHCATGTLSYRQPCHPVVMEQPTACFRHKNVLQKQS